LRETISPSLLEESLLGEIGEIGDGFLLEPVLGGIPRRYLPGLAPEETRQDGPGASILPD